MKVNSAQWVCQTHVEVNIPPEEVKNKETNDIESRVQLSIENYSLVYYFIGPTLLSSNVGRMDV